MHLDYPIHKLEKIPAEEIPNVLPLIHPKCSGFQIEGTNAALISNDWLSYLYDTDLEQQYYDLLHHVLETREDPEPVLQHILLRRYNLNFRCIRRIIGNVRFTLEFLKIDLDNTPWGSFLKQLDDTAKEMERTYYSIPHVDWVVPGPDYTVMIFCRDHQLRYLDISPLMGKAPFDRIKDPEVFKTVTAYYGALTWFPDNNDLTIDISPEWCYENGIVVDLFSLAKAVQKENPIHSMDVHHVETPRLSAGKYTLLSEPEIMDQEFLMLWLPDSASDDYPLVDKRFYGNEKDMEAYMDAASKCCLSGSHQKRLAAYRKYCDGDDQVMVEDMDLPIPLFTKFKVEYQQQVCLEDVHWCHADFCSHLIPLRARKVLLDQVILEVDDEFIYCVRPTFEGLEYANYQVSRWMPVVREMFNIANAIENRDGKFVSYLYMEAGRYKTLCNAITAMENPAQLDLRAVMDEFYGKCIG